MTSRSPVQHIADAQPIGHVDLSAQCPSGARALATVLAAETHQEIVDLVEKKRIGI